MTEQAGASDPDYADRGLFLNFGHILLTSIVLICFPESYNNFIIFVVQL